jgi:hypothetical protein
MACLVMRNVTGPGLFDGPWDGNGFITTYVGLNCRCADNSDVSGPGVGSNSYKRQVADFK